MNFIIGASVIGLFSIALVIVFFQGRRDKNPPCQSGNFSFDGNLFSQPNATSSATLSVNRDDQMSILSKDVMDQPANAALAYTSPELMNPISMNPEAIAANQDNIYHNTKLNPNYEDPSTSQSTWFNPISTKPSDIIRNPHNFHRKFFLGHD